MCVCLCVCFCVSCKSLKHIFRSSSTLIASTHYFTKQHLANLVDFPAFLVSSTFNFLYLHNCQPIHHLLPLASFRNSVISTHPLTHSLVHPPLPYLHALKFVEMLIFKL